jgi:hypothetical protein
LSSKEETYLPKIAIREQAIAGLLPYLFLIDRRNIKYYMLFSDERAVIPCPHKLNR